MKEDKKVSLKAEHITVVIFLKGIDERLNERKLRESSQYFILPIFLK